MVSWPDAYAVVHALERMLNVPKYLPKEKGVRLNQLHRRGLLGSDALQVEMVVNDSGHILFEAGHPPQGGFAVLLPWRHVDGSVRALKIWHEKFKDKLNEETVSTMNRRLEILWESFVSNGIERHIAAFRGYYNPIMKWIMDPKNIRIQFETSGYEFEWAEGHPLQTVLGADIPKGKAAQRKQLKSLEMIHNNFRTLVREVSANGVRLPDFNWKNIVANDDGELKLIDIDSIWVPAMEDEGIKGIPTTTRDFSHPQLSLTPCPQPLDGNSLFIIEAEWYQYHQLDLSFRCALEFYPQWLEVLGKSTGSMDMISPLSGDRIVNSNNTDNYEALLKDASAELRADLEKFRAWSRSDLDEVEKPIWIDIPSSSMFDFSSLFETKSLNEANGILKELGYKKRIHKNILSDYLEQKNIQELLEIDGIWGGGSSGALEKNMIVNSLLRLLHRQSIRGSSRRTHPAPPPPPSPLPMVDDPEDDKQYVKTKFFDDNGELHDSHWKDFRDKFSRAGVPYSGKEIEVELNKLTVPDLKKFTKKLNLQGLSQSRKADIIQAIVDEMEKGPDQAGWGGFVPGVVGDDGEFHKKTTPYVSTPTRRGPSRSQPYRGGVREGIRTKQPQRLRGGGDLVATSSPLGDRSTRMPQQSRIIVAPITSSDSIDTNEPYFIERQEKRGKFGWVEFIKLRPIPNLFIVFALLLSWHLIPELSAGLTDSAAIITGVVFWLMMQLYLTGYVYSVDEVTGYDAGFKKWDNGIYRNTPDDYRFDDKYLLQYAYEMKPVWVLLILCGILSVVTSFFPSPLHETFPEFFKLEMWFAVIHLILVIILFVRWSSFQSPSSNNFTLITKILMFSAISTIILAVVASQWEIFSGPEVKGFSIGGFYFGVIVTTMLLLFNRFTSFNILTDKYPIFDRLNVFLTLSIFPIFCGFNIDVETYANKHTLGILLLLISTWYLVELASLLQENDAIKAHIAGHNRGHDIDFQLSLLYRIFYSLLPLVLIILCMMLLGMVEIPGAEPSWIWD